MGTDPLSDLLSGVRASGAIIGQAELRAPWSLVFTDGADLTMLTLLSGEGWVVAGGGQAILLKSWDSVIVRGPEPFWFVDAVESRNLVAQEIRCRGDAPMCMEGVVEGQTAVVAGSFAAEGTLHNRLLRVLPAVLVVSENDDTRQTIEFVAAAASVDRPGWQVVLDRLLDWGLVCVLRSWFDSAPTRSPAWYHGMSDRVVSAALTAMHGEPTQQWTVASLARTAGVSRALLAKRFRDVMGQPPLTYLTQWRMALAEEMLHEENVTVGAVARRVGYADGFAFSAAFKRERGVSPSAYRAVACGPGS